MPNTRDIRRRIKSVASTKKITKAMELVSTSKMKKAVGAVLASRPYANLSWATVLNLAAHLKKDLHPLLKLNNDNGAKKIGIILIASNRGLCGGYNAQIINKVIKFVGEHEKESVEMFLLGKKSHEAVYKYKLGAAAEFEKFDYVNNVEQIRPLAKMIIEDFLVRKYDKILVAYTDFVSGIKQAPRIKQLLPIEIGKRDKFLGALGEDSRVGLDEKFVQKKEEKYLKDERGYKYEYKYEPNSRQILDEMLPRLIEIQIYQAMVEANASEHAARMLAMKNATDAAGDMIYDLSLAYNKARQAGITREITEITAGVNAMESN